MARIHCTQRFPLGTRVKKYFNGYRRPFEGLVDHHSDQTDFYHISYDDGDSEEMTEEDVMAHLLSLPKPKRSPKILKSTKPPTASKPTRPPKTSKPSPPPATKRETCDKKEVALSLTASKEKKRPTVLRLNANAPGLVRSNSFTGSSCSHKATSESLTASISANTLNEVEDEKEEIEEEEMEEEIEGNEDCEEADNILSEEGTPEKINLLIGKPVERTVAKEGCAADVVKGTVASYFPATKMYRVMYFDGDCCDLTYQEVFDSIPADMRPVGTGGKRKRKTEESNRDRGRKRLRATSSSLKQPKTFDMKTKDTGQTQRSPKARSPASGARSPSSPGIFHEKDMEAVDNVELNIVRKVLFIIVSTVKNTVMEAQLEALSSADLKDKEALEVFVQKDGLTSLAELLLKWEDQVETEQGVLLVLKALAVLPGVSKDMIIESRIGKKVRGIERRGSYRDSAIPSLATWVIGKLKSDAGVQKVVQKPSVGVNGKAQRDEETQLRGSSLHRRGSSSLHGIKRDDRLASTKLTDSSRPHDTRLDKGKVLAASNDGGRSNSASHLLHLMNSRTGRDASTSRRDRDIFGNVVTMTKQKTQNHGRARHSTVVIDQVSKRLTGNAQGVKFVKTKLVEDDDWKPSKISFADDNAVCAFDKDVAVSKLLVFLPHGSTEAPLRPPMKQHSGPLRSILRVRLSPSAAPETSPQSDRKRQQSAPPTISLIAKAGVDPVVIPSERTVLSSGVLEDEATELSTFYTSKLLKVVSPTEKRMQGLSAPFCIPTSVQVPLQSTDEADDGKIFASGMSDIKLDLPVETPNEPKRAEAAEVQIEALSPVLSEGVFSEDSDKSSRDVCDSALKPEAATLASCLPDLTKSSLAQQATTLA